MYDNVVNKIYIVCVFYTFEVSSFNRLLKNYVTLSYRGGTTRNLMALHMLKISPFSWPVGGQDQNDKAGAISTA